MYKKLIAFIFIAFFSKTFISQNFVTERQLNKNWKFHEEGKTKWLTATVPGCVHTDLINNGIIDDPYYRLNESKVQWIDKRDWVYLNQFVVNEKEIQKEHHELRFEGLDTYASVFLNDVLVLESNNMHRTYVVDVKNYLKKGTNFLKIILSSPINKGVKLYDALDFKIPVSANDQAENGNVPEGKRVSAFTRKAGYHYGWDWGPRLVTLGIWRPVTLISWDNFRIKDLHVRYSFDGHVYFQTHVTIESSKTKLYPSLEIKLNDSVVSKIKHLKLKEGLNNFELSFNLKKPKLWWPNGMGKQNLYDLKAELKLGEFNDSKSQVLGIRAIDFIPDSNFHFKVNNHSAFIKGVNYIPQDVFLPRVKSKDYKKILSSAAAANMNMIRVWGGGVYEDNRFYELCDSLGLMVWQDFMFACSMYPGDSDFLENVKKEAEDNYNRLKKHPCIALWCGNNENLAAWKRWGWEETAIKEQSPEIANRIWKSYDTLFHHILPKVVNTYPSGNEYSQNNPYKNYWASSPSASQGIAESYKSGDTHYWGVWWGKEPFENFNSKISCFMSEYGFQSFPEYSSFKKFAKTKDENMYSKVMKHHQRSSIGNSTIEEYMKREFNTPKTFEMLLYTSQILQSDGIRLGIEAHRRNKNKCTGSIYWQLNDCWPGASWSSIDYYGKWKALHYSVKEAFKPVIVSHEFIDSSLHITVVSDKSSVFSGEVEVILSEFQENPTIKKWTKKAQINSNKASLVLKLDKTQLPKGNDKKNTFLRLNLKENNKIISSKNVYFLPFKELNIPYPQLSHKTRIDNKSKQLIVEIKSQSFAKGVHVTSNSLENFSDNFFDLPINGTKTITIPIKNEEDIELLISSIELKSMWNSDKD